MATSTYLDPILRRRSETYATVSGYIKQHIMANSLMYWPGGVPENVRFHPQPILTSLRDEVKGWQLFLEVMWIS